MSVAKNSILAGWIALGAGLSPAPALAAATPGATLRQYLDARWKGDVAAAQALWDGEDLRRTQAMGTSFPGLEARFDDNLLWTAAERQAAARDLRPAVADSTVEASWSRYTVLLRRSTGVAAADTLRYSLRRGPDGWRVTSPFQRLAGSWTMREGRYFRLFAAKLRLVNRDALVTLDDGIGRILARLGTTDLARVRLERIKVEIYVCATDGERRELGGRPGDGGYRPAGERVVTRSIADLNGVCRVLVHLTTKDGAPHATPLLEEGLAAALGGFGSWTDGVTVQRGAALSGTSAAELEAVLDPAAMRRGAPERVVPLAALWADALLGELGPTGFLSLYRSLSGSAAASREFDAAAVRRALETATSKRGAALLTWVRDRAAAVVPPLAGGCATLPEETRALQPVLRWRDKDEQWSLLAFETGPDYTLVFGPYAGPVPKWMKQVGDSMAVLRGEKPPPAEPERPRPKGDPPQVAILVRERLMLEPEAYESTMYREDFLQRPYAGDLFALFVSPAGARLVDYRRDTVVGIHTADFTVPGSRPYYDEAAGRLCFRLRRDLLPKNLAEYVAVTLLYTGE
jgi:hypothetical protein